MNSVKCIISAPVDTYSGYGGRGRDFAKALIESYPDWDIKILSQRWGNTRKGFLKDHNDALLSSRIVQEISEQPEVWIQITVPNEFKQVGKFNIGITAGIETTLCDPTWIQGCNRMNLVLVSSTHAKETFQRSVFQINDPRTNQPTGQLRLTTPVEVLFEGVDTSLFKKLDTVSFDLSNVEENFCFLTIGHWMQGEIGQDRKNIGYTIKAFLETFKNKKNAPALILKTQQTTSSIIDRENVLDRINNIRKTVKGKLPNIYLVHGDITDSQMNELYNHGKVKALVSLTKGEGFGRPILEFAAIEKPVIVSGWSGHLDFIKKEYALFVGGTLENVHPSAAVKDMILVQSQWFKPDEGQTGACLKKAFEGYKDIKLLAKRQAYNVKTVFTYEHMRDLMQQIVARYVPEFPKQIQLKLPELKKIQLPQLKKIE